jgi:hypothetical protein
MIRNIKSDKMPMPVLPEHEQRKITLESKYGNVKPITLVIQHTSPYGRMYVSYKSAMAKTRHLAGDYYPRLVISGMAGGVAFIEPVEDLIPN